MKRLVLVNHSSNNQLPFVPSCSDYRKDPIEKYQLTQGFRHGACIHHETRKEQEIKARGEKGPATEQ